jgi:hypothetical protein
MLLIKKIPPKGWLIFFEIKFWGMLERFNKLKGYLVSDLERG